MLEKNFHTKQVNLLGEIINSKPKPFLKWAGGKRQLIEQMKNYFPKDFNNYIEPFVGGGAVFFHLYNEKLLNKEIILIDNNKELINCYKVIKKNVDDLIKLLRIIKMRKIITTMKEQKTVILKYIIKCQILKKLH